MNKAKEKLARGETVIMVNPNYPSPGLVERIGVLDCDVAFIDCEHGGINIETVEDMARAARAGGINTVLRPEANEPYILTRYLDRGVDGVMVPHVDDAASARKVVDVVRYARFRDHDHKLIIIMVESRKAVSNIDEILDVEGIDVIFIGPSDLSQDMGYPGKINHPNVQAEIDRTITAVKSRGRVVGTLVDFDNAEKMTGKGVQYLYVHANAFLATGARVFRDKVFNGQLR